MGLSIQLLNLRLTNLDYNIAKCFGIVLLKLEVIFDYFEVFLRVYLNY